MELKIFDGREEVTILLCDWITVRDQIEIAKKQKATNMDDVESMFELECFIAKTVLKSDLDIEKLPNYAFKKIQEAISKIINPPVDEKKSC